MPGLSSHRTRPSTVCGATPACRSRLRLRARIPGRQIVCIRSGGVGRLAARSGKIYSQVPEFKGLMGKWFCTPNVHSEKVMTPAEAGYLAGIIDGEGTVSVYRARRKESR